MLHPADAYLRAAPVADWWIEAIGHREGDGRSTTPAPQVAIRLSRHFSKKTLFREVQKIVAEAASSHRERRRWLSGVAASPVTVKRVEGCWIALHIDLRYRRSSLRRAFDDALFQLGPNAIEMPHRRLNQAHFLLGLWAFYRRLAEPGARSKDMIRDLQERLGLRGVGDLSLNTDLYRFRRAFIASLDPACETLRNSFVDFYLDPDSHRIVRMARLTTP